MVLCPLCALQISSKPAGSGKTACVMAPLHVCDGKKAEPVLGRFLLPSSVTALVPDSSVAMPLPVAAWRHCRRSGWRRVLRSVPECRASQPLWGASTVSPHTMKRAPLGSPQNGRNNPCDHKLQRKYAGKYGALRTCLEMMFSLTKCGGYPTMMWLTFRHCSDILR